MPDLGGMAGGARATRPWNASVRSDCTLGISTIVSRPGCGGPSMLLDGRVFEGLEEYARALEVVGAGGRLFSFEAGTRDRREL